MIGYIDRSMYSKKLLYNSRKCYYLEQFAIVRSVREIKKRHSKHAKNPVKSDSHKSETLENDSLSTRSYF